MGHAAVRLATGMSPKPSPIHANWDEPVHGRYRRVTPRYIDMTMTSLCDAL